MVKFLDHLLWLYKHARNVIYLFLFVTKLRVGVKILTSVLDKCRLTLYFSLGRPGHALTPEAVLAKVLFDHVASDVDSRLHHPHPGLWIHKHLLRHQAVVLLPTALEVHLQYNYSSLT